MDQELTEIESSLATLIVEDRDQLNDSSLKSSKEQDQFEEYPSQPPDLRIKSCFRDVFSEVSVLEAGCLKHCTPSQATFIPIFPYLYKSLKFGDCILDGNGRCDRVKLFLNGREL